jgi:hypothetical protein
MSVELNQLYMTKSGKVLMVKSVNESGSHNLVEVVSQKDRTLVAEIKNKYGLVTRRTNLIYTEETISSFKKIK